MENYGHKQNFVLKEDNPLTKEIGLNDIYLIVTNKKMPQFDIVYHFSYTFIFPV